MSIAKIEFVSAALMVECSSPALHPTNELVGALEFGEAGIDESECTLETDCRRKVHRQMPTAIAT